MSSVKGRTHPHNATLKEALRQHRLGNLSGAVALYQKSIQQKPCLDAYANLGVALRLLGRLEGAVIAYRKALKFDPEHMPTLSNLGGVLRALGHLDEAIPILEQAIQVQPDSANAYYNLGMVWGDKLQPEKAIACFEEAIRLDSDRTDAQFDRAVCLLQTGDLVRGFEAYESRFAYQKHLVRNFKKPQWDGTPLQGRTLLIYAEQGFGDTLQFIRYIDQIPKQPGDRIILECPKPLKRLLSKLPGIDRIITPSETAPHFDVYRSLLSLPHLLQTGAESIPGDYPYLKAPSKRLELLNVESRQLKVGIVWACGQNDVAVRNRSIPLNQLLPLLELPGIQFYSFQKGQPAKELDSLGFSGLIENLDSQIHDFADTAAFLEQIDLLISVDTAIVHLAGALNKPTWVLLPFSPDWRWFLNLNNSPWYPSLRLFRNTSPSSDWQALIAEARDALTQWLAEADSGSQP